MKTKHIKTRASGSTGLADALTAALFRKAATRPYTVSDRDQYSGKPVQTQNLPNPLLEKRRREENRNKINKHSAVIKRKDPRLLAELLHTFGSIEGLSAPKQGELLKRLEAIRKDYRI